MTTIITGGGASGLACAVRLKQNMPDCEVIVLEKLSSVGKKLLATGNGRCNLSNSASEFNAQVLDFFGGLGLVTREDSEGRVYPYSNQASTVLETLVKACEKLGVSIVTDCRVTGIDADLCVTTDSGMYMADNIVIAAGGTAQSALGSDGSGFELLKSIGHTVTPLYPSLVQLTSSSKYPRQLSGSRAKCSMKILLDGQIQGEEYGEVLFTDYGLSGIVTMNLSQIVSRNFAKDTPAKCHVVLDLIPDMSGEELLGYVAEFGSLDGILGSKLAGILMKQAENDAAKAAQYAKNWQLIITGTRGYDFAQITGGGAALDEFDGCMSKKVSGVFACGEVLDRQYECGGFNLAHAFYSGIKTADQITDREKTDD
jgi:hypothetical protein